MTFGYPHIPLAKGCPWSSFQPPTIKYCEENLCSWITAPANTWSNLGYVLVAYWLWKKLGPQQSSYLKLFSLAALCAGITSFLYHASYTYFYQVFDYVGMYMFSCLLLTLNLRRYGIFSRNLIIPFYFLVIIFSISLFLLSGGIYGRSIFSFQLIIVMALEFLLSIKGNRNRPTTQYKWLKISIGIFLISYIAWWADSGHFWCDPKNHIIQGHAIWHVVNAFCFITMSKFYQQFSEL